MHEVFCQCLQSISLSFREQQHKECDSHLPELWMSFRFCSQLFCSLMGMVRLQGLLAFWLFYHTLLFLLCLRTFVQEGLSGVQTYYFLRLSNSLKETVLPSGKTMTCATISFSWAWLFIGIYFGIEKVTSGTNTSASEIYSNNIK